MGLGCSLVYYRQSYLNLGSLSSGDYDGATLTEGTGCLERPDARARSGTIEAMPLTYMDQNDTR